VESLCDADREAMDLEHILKDYAVKGAVPILFAKIQLTVEETKDLEGMTQIAYTQGKEQHLFIE